MPDFIVQLWEGGSTAIIRLLVDLFIVTYLVYIVLLLVRGTRTVPMALGLLVIMIIYVLSRTFGLTATFMLLDEFMNVAMIFALIIFQDDIRRALVRMGRFARFSSAQETMVVDEVVKAAAKLAGKQIGAIVVFERDGDLDEYIHEGTRLDAAVSHELLYSIFIPRLENPLHDGAAIIKNYRLKEAGSLLPLSVNPRLDKTLGTRHRAALGITEKADAIAVVVSEERGTISLCFDGRISKNLDAQSLRKALLGLFSTEKIKARRKAAEERRQLASKSVAGGARDSVVLPETGDVAPDETELSTTETADENPTSERIVH